MNEPVNTWNLVLNLITIAMTGIVGLLVRHAIGVLQEIKSLMSRVDQMEVKVDALWGEHTDNGMSRRRRQTDR